jgi:hypothetical protein
MYAEREHRTAVRRWRPFGLGSTHEPSHRLRRRAGRRLAQPRGLLGRGHHPLTASPAQRRSRQGRGHQERADHLTPACRTPTTDLAPAPTHNALIEDRLQALGAVLNAGSVTCDPGCSTASRCNREPIECPLGRVHRAAPWRAELTPEQNGSCGALRDNAQRDADTDYTRSQSKSSDGSRQTYRNLRGAPARRSGSPPGGGANPRSTRTPPRAS